MEKSSQNNSNNKDLENIGNIKVEEKDFTENEITGEESISSLKVKADADDITPEERKRNVKKLAGAISHSLRGRGEINIRCFGSAAISKGAKAIAIARSYINAQNLQLECSPGFITTKMGDSELTGICFSAFSGEKSANNTIKDLDIVAKCKTTLMVKADPKDVDAETRKESVKRLASAIDHALKEHKEVAIRCFGNATIGKSVKAMAIARGKVANRGPDMYCWPTFIVAEMNGQERTGICWYAHTNEI